MVPSLFLSFFAVIHAKPVRMNINVVCPSLRVSH